MSRGSRAALILVAGLSCAGFILRGQAIFGSGFPLDDAWIHQTYARNFALRGEWSFLAGQPANGSTSPLWTLLLAPAHALHIDPVVWSHLLGGICLALLGVVTTSWAARRFGRPTSWGLAAGLLTVSEWHLAWASASGMEILLFAVLIVAFLRELDGSPIRPQRAGVWMGLAIWVRPEGLLLLVPLLWKMGFRSPTESSASWRRAGRTLAWALPFLAGFLLFNASFRGELWPNTFAAKQEEYAIERRQLLPVRLAEQAGAALNPAGLILLPGVLMMVGRAARLRAWGHLAPLAWVAAHWGAYALRLPVVYQHGRYAMPTIPVMLLLGVEGMAQWVQPVERARFRRLLGRVWAGTLGAATLAFWVLGSAAYGKDVAVIETEMVATARWIDGHTESQALIAAHDIGALGYFGNRQILDLAGLVSPEVVGFLRDERRLAAYLDARGADYLMTFPGWYPALTDRAVRVYTSPGTFSPALGGENMAVYRW